MVDKKRVEIEVSVKGDKKADNSITKIKNKFKDLTKSIIKSRLSWAALTIAVGAAVRDFADFELKMINVGNLTGATSKEIGKMSFALMEMATRIPVSAGELADALFQVQSAGVAAGDSIEFLEASAKLARAGLTDTKTAVDGLTSVINAYGLEVKEVTRISDIFFAAQVEGKTTIGELSNTIGRLAPISRAAGVSIEEMFAAVTTLTKAGIKTDEAVVSLRGTMNSLIAPTTEAKKKFDELGIDLSGVGKEGFSLVKVLKQIQEQTGGNVEEISALIPNVRALTGVLSLAGEQYSDFVEVSGKLDNALGQTEQAFQETQKTVDAQIKLMQNSVSNFTKSAVFMFAVVVNGTKKLINWKRGIDEAFTSWVQGISGLDKKIERHNEILEASTEAFEINNNKKLELFKQEEEAHTEQTNRMILNYDKQVQAAAGAAQGKILASKLEATSIEEAETKKQEMIENNSLAQMQTADDVGKYILKSIKERLIGEVTAEQFASIAKISMQIATAIASLNFGQAAAAASQLAVPAATAAVAVGGINAVIPFAQGGQFESQPQGFTTTTGQNAIVGEKGLERITVEPIGRAESNNAGSMVANITINLGGTELKKIATQLKPYMDAKDRGVF